MTVTERKGRGDRHLCLWWVLCILLAVNLPSAARALPESPDSLSSSGPPSRARQSIVIDGYNQAVSSRFIHRLGTEVRGGWVPGTNRFLKGENWENQRINQTYGAHLKYAFQFNRGTVEDQLYGSVYQGIGVGVHTFLNREELGDPVMVYLLQGGRIGQLNPRLAVFYEWQLGLSWNWKPYDRDENYYNTAIGSKVNAYLNGNIYLNWMVSRELDVSAGVSAFHFSNGNTRLPNGGVNAFALNVGAVYHFNREYDRSYPVTLAGADFKRHFSHELMLFGSWRRKGLRMEDGTSLVPTNRRFQVYGFSWATMYNLNYKFRVGAALDGVYDHSANIQYVPGSGYGDEDPEFLIPPFREQAALGVSLRGDFVMPYFTISAGLGYTFLHEGDDLASFYQMLALKVDMTRNTYLNIGYRLKRFRTPNFLMLGIGYRFNNKSQTYRP